MKLYFWEGCTAHLEMALCWVGFILDQIVSQMAVDFFTVQTFSTYMEGFTSCFTHYVGIFYSLVWLWLDKSLYGLKVCNAHMKMCRFLVYVVYILRASADASRVEYSVGMGQASSWLWRYFSCLFLIFIIVVDFLYFVLACILVDQCIVDMISYIGWLGLNMTQGAEGSPLVELIEVDTIFHM